MNNAVFLLVRLVVAAVGGGLVLWWWHWYLGGLAGFLFGMVFAAPIAGMALARPLVEISHDGMSWLAGQSMAKYQGRYYAFDGKQVRIEESDDGLLFHARDVAQATTLDDIPWRGHDYVDIATVEKWLGKRREPAAGKFLLWARREVVAPYEKRSRS